MSKNKKRSVPVAPPKQEKKMVIDMNAMNLKKEHAVPGFRTGRHMTEKDRPRKKDWKREWLCKECWGGLIQSVVLAVRCVIQI